MTADSVLAVLREHASAETLAQMGPRYGIHAASALGVPMAAMKKVARDLGRDHALACELWATGDLRGAHRSRPSSTSRPLVTRRADGRLVRRLRQLGALRHRVLLVVRPGSDAWSRLEPWARDERELVRRASFALLWSLALHDTSADDARFVAGLALVEQDAADERPLVTKSMSCPCGPSGGRSPALDEAVRATAERLAGADSAPARRIGRTALRESGD